MITRIEVDGFKSLRGFSLEFEPLTAVVGANGAGKSNVFDVLRLLSCLPRMNIIDAFRSLRGHIRDQFSQTKAGPVEQLTITTDFLFAPLPDDEETNRWRHFIRVERMPTNATITETLEVTEERLWNLRENEDDWMMRHSAFRPLVRYRDSVMTAGRPAVPKSMFPMSLQSSMARLDQSGVHPLATELTNIRLLHPDPGKLRVPSDRAAGATLLADGSNLPTALAATTPEIRAQIRADLADLVPGFRSFEVVPHDDELRLEIEFSDGTRTPARVLSDGTLRLFAVLTLLRTQSFGNIIAIEEPENGIYPGRLQALMKKLEMATTVRGSLPPQILLNSHSPSLVAGLHHRPECLVFADLVRMRDGLRSTRMRHVRTDQTPARDVQTVSLREIENYLDSARPAEEA